jgi:hypothetical protein
MVGDVPHHRLSRVLDRADSGMLAEAIEGKNLAAREAHLYLGTIVLA